MSENLEADTITWQWRTVQPTALRDYQTYTKVSNLVSICVSLANFLSLLVLNLCIYITIRRKSSLISSSQRHQRDIFIATILVTIVFMFAVCHSCKAFITIVELCHVISGQTDNP